MMARGMGLVWEEWCRTRKGVVAVMAVVAASWTVVWTLEERKRGIALAAVSAYGVFALLVYLLLGQSTRASIAWSVPASRYRLPASSFELAFWPFVYRLAVVSAGAILIAAIDALIEADFPFYTPLFVFWLILSALHTLAYASPLLGKWLPGLLIILMLFPGAALFMRVYQSPAWRYPLYDLAGMAAAAAAALLLSTAAIAKTRAGGFAFTGIRIGRAKSSGGAVPAGAAVEKRPFRSAAGAQRWFEWTSIVKTLLLLLSALTVVFVLAQVGSSAVETEAVLRLEPTMAVMMILVNAAVAGLWAFANQSARVKRPYSMFIQTRPVSDLRLARAKLEIAAIVILAEAAVVAGALLALTAGVFPQEWEWRHLLLAPATLCLAWIVYWRAPVVAASVIGFVVFTETAPELFKRWIYSDPALKPAALAFMAVSLVVMAIPFLRAWRREILRTSAVAAALAAWAAGTALATFLLLRYAYPELDTTSALMMNALLALLAITPFARVPLTVARTRHE